jgi:hypothetical protein
MLDDFLEKKTLPKDRMSAGDGKRNAPHQTQASSFCLNSQITVINLFSFLIEFLIVPHICWNLYGFKLTVACPCIQFCTAIWEAVFLSMTHAHIESLQVLGPMLMSLLWLSERFSLSWFVAPVLFLWWKNGERNWFGLASMCVKAKLSVFLMSPQW